MDIFIYSDESGVFDPVHNDYFVFGGVICFSKNEKNVLSRKYKHFEDTIREYRDYGEGAELKASLLSNKDKGKAYRSLNNVFKFCVVINEAAVHKKVFEQKKTKQRYMDYAYKMVLKRCFKALINKGMINPGEIGTIHVFADEHATATDGKYELRENLLNEFKYGTFNEQYLTFFEPIFPKLADVEVQFCHSDKVILVRAADIIANHCYHAAINNGGKIAGKKNLFVLYMPSNQIGSYGFSQSSD